MAENCQPVCSKLFLVKKYDQETHFHKCNKTSIINVYKIFLKSNPHTTISDTAGKVAFLMEVATRSMFKILTKYKSISQGQLQGWRTKNKIKK
jgi:hypothetical protein